MKRAVALRRLSREHHHALVLARDAGAGHVDAEEVRRRFDRELFAHFLAEERILLPALRAANAAPLADRTEREHALIREHVIQGNVSAFARLLEAHVRFEERELFPACERLLSSEILSTI